MLIEVRKRGVMMGFRLYVEEGGGCVVIYIRDSYCEGDGMM